MASKLANLKKLIPANLNPLKSLEGKLLAGCIEGRLVSGDFIEKAKQEKNVIRGEFLSWLCGDKEANKLIHHSGIFIENVVIEGQVILEAAILDFPLRIKKSTFNSKINLNGATIVNLDLSGSQLLDGLTADLIKTHASILFADGFTSNREVTLRGAEIRGSLNCWKSFFDGNGESTINATLSKIEGSVFLDESMHKNGDVRFSEANIRGSFDCDGGDFENGQGYSINLERAKIIGSVFLRGKEAKKISSVGTIRLYEAWIGGALEFANGRFEAPIANKCVIDAKGLTTNGDVQFKNEFYSEGEVYFYGATIGGGFSCTNAIFKNEKGNSIDLEKAKISKILLLSNKFLSEGTVRLQETNIGGSLSCEDCTFDSKEQYFAIIADGLVTGGVVNLRNKFKTVGGVSLYAARIGNELDCSGAAFGISKDDYCFVGEEMRVEGNFKWKKYSDHEPVKSVGYVSFRNARVRSFVVDKESFPEEGKLDIDGFVYDSFDIEPKFDDHYFRSPYAKTKLTDLDAWAKLLPSYQKSLQPYTQLIKVLSSSGHDKEARKIAIKREQQRSKHLGKFLSYLTDCTWGLFVDYGYNPWKAVIFMLAFIVLGNFIFGRAYGDQILTLTQNDLDGRTPIFSSITYSIDVFLPIVDLHQEDHWIPSIDLAKCKSPSDKCWQESIFVMNYMWVQIGFGWLLTTFFVTALTGVIRTDVDK